MLSLARFSIHRPKTALAIWSVVAVVLVVIGLIASSTLSPPVTVVPGTASARAERLAGAQFGPTQLVPILVEGPATTLNREGPALVRRLAARPHTRVLSAWDAGSASAQLRPRPTAAMIVVSVDRPEVTTDRYDYPQIQRIVHTQIHSPLRAYVSGQPSIDLAEHNAALASLRQDLAIGAAVVFVLLLIGLRAPVAALLVTVLGGVTMLATWGEVTLLGHLLTLDAVGLAAGTMVGLALTVGFALLILDRFHHEERLSTAHPRDPAPAAMLDLEGTGRAVLVAGSALVLGLALVALIGPTTLMVSVGTGALSAGLFAIGGTVVVMPAALVLLGRRIDWLSFPAPAFAQRAWSRIVDGGGWVTRNAIGAGALATAALLALAVPALALNTGPMSISQLPAGSQARIAFNEIGRVMGAGWATPYNVVVVANGRPITTPAVLASLTGFQTQLAHDQRVYSVTGPGSITATAKQLSSFEPQLKHSAKISSQSKKDLLKLIKGLGLAGSGSQQLQSGLAAASAGAGQLHGGSGQAKSGAGQIHSFLAQAQAGSVKLRNGLSQALAGANALKAGSVQLLAGSKQAHGGASQSVAALNTLSGQSATLNADVAQALTNVKSMTTGKNDPKYGQAVAALETASAQAGAVKALSGQIASQAPALVHGLQQLTDGIARLSSGNSQLASGIAQLNAGGGQLTSGLSQLTAGAGALETGLGQLTTGAGQLATGLAGGVSPAGQLIAGLNTMQAAVVKARGQIPSTKQLEQLFRQSPGLFNSGYFVLAAVAGATRNERNAATFAVNLTRGGTAGQIVVVSKYPSNDPRTQALGTHLVALSHTFAANHNLQMAVGGPQGNLGDLTHATRDRLWTDVAVLSAAVVLVLALALRSIVMPLVSTAFALLTTAASFGVLQLLFGGGSPPLGGPGYLDPVTVISVFTIAFSLSVIFSALLLMRTREDELAGHPRNEAIRRALRATAAPATGAGIVMVGALVPFMVTDLINIRELGVGVAVAVLLDVLLVRPVLLPAAEMLLARRRRERAGTGALPEGQGHPQPTH